MICFHCGGSYRWVFQNRKWHALNVEDDANHWATCPGARRKAARGKAQRNHIQGPNVRGPLYVASCGNCNVPPWEVCACSFQCTAADRLNAEADKRLELALGDA